MIIIVMGVSGSGKSTLARALSRALGWVLIEGDDLHPPANVAKMSRGVPLDDDDRRPWLARLRVVITDLADTGRSGVVACSALARHHREQLAGGVAGVRFVHLYGDPGVIAARLRARADHFMPPVLLSSQMAALEPPADAVQVPIEHPTARQLEIVMEGLGLETGR